MHRVDGPYRNCPVASLFADYPAPIHIGAVRPAKLPEFGPSLSWVAGLRGVVLGWGMETWWLNETGVSNIISITISITIGYALIIGALSLAYWFGGPKRS